MRRIDPSRVALLVFGWALCTSQTCGAQAREWLVDAAGGPGSHFTDLPPAVAAAAPGDLIRVRPGEYLGFSTSKGLQIIATTAPRAPVVRAATVPALRTIEVVGLPPDQRFGMVGIQVQAPAGGGAALELRGCVGDVHIEYCGLEMAEQTTAPTPRPALLVTDSAHVYLSYTTMLGFPAAAVERSGLRATNCVFLGIHGGVVSPTTAYLAGHGVAAAFSDLEFSRCLLHGGDVRGLQFGLRGGSGIFSVSSIWTLRSDVGGSVIAGQVPGVPVAAARGTGRVHHDPVVSFLGTGGGPGMEPGLSAVPEPLPSMALVYLPGVGTMRVDVHGLPGDAYLFLFGLPSDPRPVNGLGDLQLDLTAGVILGAGGTIDGSGYASATYPISNDAALRGLRFGWQALRSVPGGGFAFTNLAAYLHR